MLERKRFQAASRRQAVVTIARIEGTRGPERVVVDRREEDQLDDDAALAGLGDKILPGA